MTRVFLQQKMKFLERNFKLHVFKTDISMHINGAEFWQMSIFSCNQPSTRQRHCDSAAIQNVSPDFVPNFCWRSTTSTVKDLLTAPTTSRLTTKAPGMVINSTNY